MPQVILIAVVAGATASLLRAVRVGDRGVEIVAKTVASVAFVILGATGWSHGDGFTTWIVAGLALCAVGDVLLLWDRTFDAGLGTFLLGHIAYIAAFHHVRSIDGWSMAVLAPLVLAGFGAAIWLWPYLEGRRASVSAYIAVISVMVWGAIAATTAGRSPMLAIGALFFYLSDLTVARHRFVASDFVNRAVGLPLYYAGQVLIALSA
jgi:uncharacterized membrane protein YhhN